MPARLSAVPVPVTRAAHLIPALTLALLTLALVAAAGCASRSALRERLDPQTGTTVTQLARPVQLTATEGVVAGSAAGPPSPSRSASEFTASSAAYAWLAPFEADVSGQRTQYLWLAVALPVARPALLRCDGRPLALEPVEDRAQNRVPDPAQGPVQAAAPDLRALGISQPPYASPVPWATQSYYRMAPADVACLLHAQVLDLELASGDRDVRYRASGLRLAGVGGLGSP